jgi:RNA polymerase sigma factor (sigma-70 family)
MGEESSFTDLIRRVRSGDDSAAAELVRQYEPAIRRAVRLRLDPRLRRNVDTMDITQAVLGSFFVRAAAGQFELDTPEQLLKLLATMARHKLGKARRYQLQAKRDDRRMTAASADDQQLAAADSSPSRQVSAKEMLAEVRRRLSPEEQQLMELRGQGHDWLAIAAQLGGSAEALRKKLGRAVARITDQMGVDGTDEE